MPTNPRILVPLKLPTVLPIRLSPKPRPYITPHRQNSSSVNRKWTGSDYAAHSVAKARKGDRTDPESSASGAGLEEREENEAIADEAKSQAATEREGRKFARKAKKDHPNAPEPIIGMNDERAEKGN